MLDKLLMKLEEMSSSLSFDDLLNFLTKEESNTQDEDPKDHDNISPENIHALDSRLWSKIFSYLGTEDLKNVVVTCHHFRDAGQDPGLAWRRMRVKVRTVLMYGLQHLLSSPRFAHLENLDFSSIQLETRELELLCRHCCNNNFVRNLNLSDKVLVDIDDHLLCQALSKVINLTLR